MKEKIAKDLLKIQAVFLRPDEPFTWASGIKSPIYCDNRLTLSDHQVRLDVENGLAAIVKENYPEVEALMGTSTAGIAHAAITAHLMGLPMGYVRSGAKDHGRKNQIEGKLLPGQKVVVIEDLISTGGSVLEVVDVLRQAGAEVLGIASIFTYGMKKSVDRLVEANVKNVSLTDLDTVAQVAAAEGYIRPEDQQRLLKFRENPSDESWIQKQLCYLWPKDHAVKRKGSVYETRFDRHYRPFCGGDRRTHCEGGGHHRESGKLPGEMPL